MQTARDTVVSALRLMGNVNSYGNVDENSCAKYFGAAPAFLNILIHEISAAEKTQTTQAQPVMPSSVQTLDSALSISDDSAVRVLPFGLAMYFSVIDRDSESYNYFSQLYYGTLLPSIKTDEAAIQDYYGVMTDVTFR